MRTKTLILYYQVNFLILLFDLLRKCNWISSLWTRLPTTDSRWTSAIWRRIMSTWTLQCQVDFKKNVFWRKNNWLNDTGLLEIPSYGLAVVILLYGGRRIPYFGCVQTTLMTNRTRDENHETAANFTELVFQVDAPLWTLAALNFLGARRPTHTCPCHCALWWDLVLPLRRFSKGLIFNNNFFSGKMCITFSFGVIFLYGAELFPTEIRTSGLGSASFVGRSFTSITLS